MSRTLTTATLQLCTNTELECRKRACRNGTRTIQSAKGVKPSLSCRTSPLSAQRGRTYAKPSEKDDWAATNADDYVPTDAELDELDRQARELAMEYVGELEQREWELDDEDDEAAISRSAALRISSWDEAGDDEDDDGKKGAEGGLRLTVNEDWVLDEDEDDDEDDAPSSSRSAHADAGVPAGLEGADEDTVTAFQKMSLGQQLSRRERSLVKDFERSHVREIPARLLPKVAIVGRPNVGKSALFNRFVGRQEAIVYDYPGVTRDRLYMRSDWNGREFMVVDTGGISSDAPQMAGAEKASIVEVPKEAIPSAIEQQAAVAIAEADVVVLVVDGQQGPTAADEEVAQYLRRWHGNKPVVLCVNKCENVAEQLVMASPFWAMGIEPIPVSAISGSGSGELLDAVVEALPPPKDQGEEEARRAIRVAIVGRPNAGKSSLLNAIVGRERSIVSDLAGTTRDAIDTEFTGPDGTPFVLVDTAGIRRRTSVAASKDGAESLSVQRSLAAIRRADVAVLVMDAKEGVTVQDFRLAERIAEEGRACVICVNKWDLVLKDSNTLAQFEKQVRSELRPIDFAEIVFTSAKTKQRVANLLDAAVRAAKEHERRVPTATLNIVVQEAMAWKAPPLTKGSKRRGRVYYATQATNRPPTFVFFCNDSRLIPDDYRRYVERQLREAVGFPGTPVRLLWRGKGPSGRVAPPTGA